MMGMIQVGVMLISGGSSLGYRSKSFFLSLVSLSVSLPFFLKRFFTSSLKLGAIIGLRQRRAIKTSRVSFSTAILSRILAKENFVAQYLTAYLGQSLVISDLPPEEYEEAGYSRPKIFERDGEF